MRRKKDDKRVLRAGNGRNTRKSRGSKLKFRSNDKPNNRKFRSNNNMWASPHPRQKKQKKIQQDG